MLFFLINPNFTNTSPRLRNRPFSISSSRSRTRRIAFLRPGNAHNNRCLSAREIPGNCQDDHQDRPSHTLICIAFPHRSSCSELLQGKTSPAKNSRMRLRIGGLMPNDETSPQTARRVHARLPNELPSSLALVMKINLHTSYSACNDDAKFHFHNSIVPPPTRFSDVA